MLCGSLVVELGIQVEEHFREVVDEEWLKQIVEQALAAEGIRHPVELGLVITNDEVMCNLNRVYRNIDATTDVLSFALHEENPEHDESVSFVPPPDGVLHLGEIIISYPQAQRQAQEYQHTIEEEMELLIIHGLRNLLGHEEPKHEQETGAIG